MITSNFRKAWNKNSKKKTKKKKSWNKYRSEITIQPKNSNNEFVKWSNSRFVTRKCTIINDQSNANYDVRNEIIYNIEVLKSNVCDYGDNFYSSER